MPPARCLRVSNVPPGPAGVAPRTTRGHRRVSSRIDAMADRPAFMAEINSLRDRMIRDDNQLTIRTENPGNDDRASGSRMKQAPLGHGRS